MGSLNEIVQVTLGTFACFCIESHLGPDIAAGLRTVTRSYAHGLESGSAPIVPPSFLRERSMGASGVRLDLTVEPEVQTVLEREARKRAVRLEQLLDHAVFVYLANSEESSTSGRYRGNEAPPQS